uniref:Uncharacterized protein n=1 Tax=Sphaerodactylus townsendi TaxID=933632 RepID=A0ACB8ECP7_9SAUR
MVGRLSLQEVPDLPDAKRRGERPLDSPDSGLPPSPSPAHWLPASAERGGLANGLLHEPAGAAGGTRVPATTYEAGQLPAQAGVSLAPGDCLRKGPGPWLSAVPLTVVLSHGGLSPAAPYISLGHRSPKKEDILACPFLLNVTQGGVSTSRLCLLSFGEGVEFDPLPPKDVRYTSSVKYDSEKHFINNVYLPMGLGMTSCSQTVVCVPDSTWRSYKAELHLEPRPKPRHFTSTAIVYPKHTKTVYTTTLDYNCKKVVRRFLSSVELESAERSGSNYNPEDC